VLGPRLKTDPRPKRPVPIVLGPRLKTDPRPKRPVLIVLCTRRKTDPCPKTTDPHRVGSMRIGSIFDISGGCRSRTRNFWLITDLC
jgi:hypothetical protein